MLVDQLFLLLALVVNGLANNVRYIVFTPQTVRPGMIYNVVTMLLGDELPEADIYASIVREDEVLAEASSPINPNVLSTLPIKVSMSILPGKYTLNVEGRSKGILIFQNSTQLVFDPNFLSIVVQTSRPIYRAGQEVRFRVITIHTNLRPFNDGLEIYVLDPDGLIMRRWVSAFTNNGVSSLRFKLPKLAKDGYWKIRIKAWNQIEEQVIKVETYFDPLFEVHVKLPPYAIESEEEIKGSVIGLYTTQRIVKGNGTVTLLARRWQANDTFVKIWTEAVFFKGKDYQIGIPMNTVESKMGSVVGIELRLDASITELLSRETVEGFSHTRIISAQLRLMFLSSSPTMFKPGLPFYGHVAVMYEDNEKVPSEILMESKLRIQVNLELESGHTVILPNIVAGKHFDNSRNSGNTNGTKEIFVNDLAHDEYLENGVLRFNFDTNHKTKKITIKAIFNQEDGSSVESRLEAVSYYSRMNKFISVQPSSTNIVVDEYAIFHVKANFIMDHFQYLVISKNEIITSGEFEVKNVYLSTTTLPLSLNSEMAPAFTLLVFHVTEDGEMLVDSCFLPTDGFSKYNTELEINTGKDHKAERVEVRASGGEGAFIGVHAVRASAYMLQAGNEISLSRVVQHFMRLDNTTRKFNKIKWRKRDGTAADQVQYFTSMDSGFDTYHTLTLAGINIFSSEMIVQNPAPGLCNPDYELPCDSSSCFPINKTCDGMFDCASGYDEIMCFPFEDSEFEYKISRTSRNEFMYDMREADWGWREIKVNDHEGVEFEPLTAPATADDWYFTAFSINTDLGFSMISEPVVFSSKRNFMMHVSGPSTCFTGEQLALQVELINNYETESLLLLVLKGSANYKFVNVEEGGNVASYSAQLTSGDHHLLVYLEPESQAHIDFPITPTIEQGEIDIEIVGTAQTGVCERRHTVKVQGGGVLINKHTSVFLDLKNRALVMSYLDIIVEETPIIPYSINRRYVYGSTSASISIFGDIIGPAFSTVPATMESTLKTSAKGTLARVFEFGVNIWTLHYLRLTNKLQRPFLKEVLLECNAVYAEILKRFHMNGYFRNWDSSGFSVWLTAWTLRLLNAAKFPDWEYLLYVDPKITENGVTWLLEYQSENGSFFDESSNLDSKMNTHQQDVPLTAHVLITLCECLAAVSGEVKARAAIASQRAASYLERTLHTLHDPHHLAISVYALSVSAGHSDVEYGYRALFSQLRQNSDGFIYWSSKHIPANPVKKENQRPFVKPRLYHEGDSVAVETTAWMLLIILHREGVTETSEKMVQWLNSMRMTSGGFVSMVDTVITLQALTEYAFRARLHEITNMNVVVELPTSGNKTNKVHIDNSSVLFQKEFEIPAVWGNVIIVAQGAGQAIAQMDVNYGVDYESLLEVPTIPTFDLNIREYYSNYRNKSGITIQSCFRWLRAEPVASSAATLEVDTPTGYHLVESEAERIARRGSHPTLRDALVTHTKIIWFFEKIERHWTCFNYTLRRWYPVANMSLHRQALLYETTARERFVQVLVNSTPLHILNICEVCGSYQCPYCPNYNTAPNITASTLLYLILVTQLTYVKLFI